MIICAIAIYISIVACCVAPWIHFMSLGCEPMIWFSINVHDLFTNKSSGGTKIVHFQTPFKHHMEIPYKFLGFVLDSETLKYRNLKSYVITIKLNYPRWFFNTLKHQNLKCHTYQVKLAKMLVEHLSQMTSTSTPTVPSLINLPWLASTTLGP
jgi:hypothetical protein